ncbi:uncharacterized protein [Clytia hemisphaerica]|uniref:uncharacterized protein n=1 Tax=Clytia hemisphaerica TaxID=252671 RepID=UPI0034D3C1DC
MAGIVSKILSLKPNKIDPTKCDPEKSLYQQIRRNSEATSERQERQFNLGGMNFTSDPVRAAEFVLEREYGDSSLFVEGEHTSVFIPPTFTSNQYTNRSPVAILNYEVKADIERLVNNLFNHSPDYWLTIELHNFMLTQFGEHRTINQKDFDQWVFNLKIMYLVIESGELNNEQLNLPSTTSSIEDFVQACINKFPSNSPGSALKTLLRQYPSKRISFKKNLKKLVEDNPPQDSNLKWLFDLELSQLGEKVEQWMYNQLLPLRDDVLQDTVVLSSPSFLINVQKKMHKEIGFLIISWERKLIISIEAKRELGTDTAFLQLELNFRIFEERLGDQLGSEWIFFPVVCVENDSLLINSKHYITTETEIQPWLTSIFRGFLTAQVTIKPTLLNETKNLLQILIFALHIMKKDRVAPITTTNWVEYTSNAIDNISTCQNILFYSNQQMAIMNLSDTRYGRLIICGNFGVGKSLLLQQKAIQINQQPRYQGKVMFVSDRVGQRLNSILSYRLMVDLKEDHGIFVEGMDINYQHSDLIQKVQNDGIKAVFIDECEMGYTSDGQWMKKLISLVDFLWIVPSTSMLSMRSLLSKYERDFTFLDLSKNLRNTPQIVQAAKAEAERSEYLYGEGIAMPPPNFPKGRDAILSNSFEDGLKKARTMTKSGILVITDKINHISNGSAMDQMRENWKSLHPERNDFGDNENPYEFLTQGNILVIAGNLSFGFEWPTIILFQDGNDYQFGGPSLHRCNFIMRCTTNLIIVRTEKNTVRNKRGICDIST